MALLQPGQPPNATRHAGVSAALGKHRGNHRGRQRGRAVGQGIAAGEFDELVDAIRAGVTYANVHTATFQTGEIRAQLERGRHSWDGHLAKR